MHARPGAAGSRQLWSILMIMKAYLLPFALVASLAADGALAQKPAVTTRRSRRSSSRPTRSTIDNGKIALKQSKTASVDEFANLMIKDHTAVNNNAIALVTKLGVKPEASDTSKSLQSAADKEQAKLRGLKGAEFDPRVPGE
jgi:putative membrane protein